MLAIVFAIICGNDTGACLASFAEFWVGRTDKKRKQYQKVASWFVAEPSSEWSCLSKLGYFSYSGLDSQLIEFGNYTFLVNEFECLAFRYDKRSR